MSLDELTAQAEAEEQETEVEEPETQDEPEEPEEPESDGSSEEEEGDETEEPESEEFELELDGEPEPDQQKPSPEEAILHKLTKQRKKRQEAESENEQLKQRLAELEAKLSGGTTQPHQSQKPELQLPRFPEMYDPGIDGDREKFDRAVKQWWVDARNAEQAVNQRSQYEEAQRKQIEDKSRELAQRVGKFATEHKMSGDYVANAVERARQEIDDASGLDGSLAFLLDAVGEGSEKAAIWIGTDKGARDLQKVKELLAQDSSGLKATAYLARIASRKPAQKRTSKAPEPDQPLRGDGSSKSVRKLQEAYDKASNEMNLGKMRELQQKAEKIGAKLK